MLQAKEQFAQYLQRRYGDRSTPKHYLSDLAMFIRQVGHKQPADVMAQDVDQFVSQQVEQGLKPATVNRRLASLHTFFEFLASQAPDKVWPNPVNWRRHRVQDGQALPRDASESDVTRLFAVMEDPRDRAMFGLMVGAGLRVGEVAGLLCADLEAPVAPDQGARLRVCGKGRKERIVWVTPSWYGMVQVWLVQRPPAGTDHLFLNQHNRPMSVAGIQYRLKQHCQRAGVQLSCHQLRHTFARRLADQRMPTESIAQLLGHAQIETTQRYTAGANPDLRDSFLTAMAEMEDTPSAASETTLSPPRPRPATEQADQEALEQVLQRLEGLPDWLQGVLSDYLRYRWRNWRPDRAVDNARAISYQLAQIWDWLVTQRQLTAWGDLCRLDVEAWLDARSTAGIAASTRRNQLAILLSSLRFADERGLPISANVFRVPSPAAPDPLPRYLPAEEYQRLLQTVYEQTVNDKPHDALDRAWFLTLAHTGVRTCELLNLRLGDLDFATQRLFVRGGKNNRDRVVFLTPILTTALAHYLAHRPQTTDDHLWIDDDKPLTANRVRYCVQRWGEICQVAVSPHRLRHTLATQLVNQGMPLPAVGKLLGHRSLNTTQHYARLHERTVKEQFEVATAHIEGIAAVDWPQGQTDSLELDEKLVVSIDDSV